MDTLLFLCLLSVAFPGLTRAVGIVPDVNLTAAVGDTVTFNTSLDPSQTQITFIEWKKDSTPIVTYSDGGTIPVPDYEGRITLFPNSAALELRNVTLTDSGVYHVTVINNGAAAADSRRMDVYVRVSDVVVVLNATALVEFNSSVSLTCNAFGSALSFHWVNDSSVIRDSDRVQINDTDGGITLIISPVTRYDRGPYMCFVHNPISIGYVSLIKLFIGYGPENVNLMVSPSQLYYGKGSDVVLSCVADSRPASQFHWYLNGETQSHSGPELRLNNIQLHQSGNYNCQAFNEKTLRYQTSPASAIHVLETISGASINASENLLLLEGKSVNLSCEAIGAIFNRTWLKDGSPLILNKNMSLHDEDRVLHFDNLQKTNKGEYSCTLSNPVSHDEATYTMIINYGPENIIIEGPSDVKEKETFKLTCSVDSSPTATFNWSQNGTEILIDSDVLSITKAELNHSGDYLCRARNHVTQRTLSAEHRLSVTASPDVPPLSPGAIAGITIACLLVVGLVVGVGVYIFKKRGSSKRSTSENTRHDGVNNRAEGERTKGAISIVSF